MEDTSAPFGETRLACKHMAVSVLGFGVDAGLLQVCLHLGMEPAWARVVSLATAMQVTFVINGLHVFRGLTWDRKIIQQWASYMATNSFGNVCNYWIFVTLVSLHWRFISTPMVAVTAASMVAWGINYSCTRLLVFGAPGRALAAWACRRWDGVSRRSPAIAAPNARPGPSPLSPE